jgi:hypothetical protein
MEMTGEVLEEGIVLRADDGSVSHSGGAERHWE